MKTALATALVLAGAACPAHAALVVSKAATSNVACVAGTCSATAADAVLNVNDLKHLLAAGDVTVASGSMAEDIVFAAKLQWTKPGRLTLDAWRGIDVALDITSEGTGGVTLTTNDGGSGGELVFTGKGKVSFWDVSSSLVINGTAYTLVDSIKALSDAVAANPNGAYALSKFYDASADGEYANDPVPAALGGTFEGLGHTIENLTLAPKGGEDHGFFASIAAGGAVRDLAFQSPKVVSTHTHVVAVLAGINSGTVSHVNVAGAAMSGTGWGLAGLAGENDGGTIQWCATSGSIAAMGKGAMAGGIAGSSSGTIAHVSSSASVSGNQTGGLVGINAGAIVLSAATGAVAQSGFLHEDTFTGGLTGHNYGTIDQSFATGAVNGGSGGQGNIHHGKPVHYKAYSGGLTGDDTGTITNSYSTGSVTRGGDAYYAGFNVSSQSPRSISTSYATGAIVNGTNTTYGFAYEAPGAASDYWDIDTSGTTTGCDVDCTGITGLTTAQFQSGLPAGFDPAIWAQSPAINNGYPYLIANPPG
jgi:hypothetical protein